jgi:hypothetical protein
VDDGVTLVTDGDIRPDDFCGEGEVLSPVTDEEAGVFAGLGYVTILVAMVTLGLLDGKVVW